MKKILFTYFVVLLIVIISFSGCLGSNTETTGDRIWNESMQTTYTWDARNFSGFYYDLNTGQGNEYMTITNIGRTIDADNIYYQTTASDMSFGYSGWGTYQGLGFVGDKYFAGSNSANLMKMGYLAKVLIDDSEDGYDNINFPGQSIALKEGYSVRIEQIDINGNNAYLVLEKDGERIASGIVNNDNSTFKFERNINGVSVPIVMIYVSGIYAGNEDGLMTVGGIFQTSDNLVKLENGTKIDKMVIRNINTDAIIMTNSEKINLERDSEVILMNKIKLLVADSDTLRFVPTIERTTPEIYKIRGAVSDFSNPEYIINKWTNQNFEGIHYNIDDDIIISESINVNSNLSSTDRIIDTNKLNYTINTIPVSYEYSNWGNYSTIDFMGERYYAGVDGRLLNQGNLSKVLINTVERKVIYLNQSLALEEGMSVKVDQFDIDGTKALIRIEKDGTEMGSQIVKAGDTLTYSPDVLGVRRSEREPLIKIQIDSVFVDAENSFVTISGIFQASENLTKINRSEGAYGKMRIRVFDNNGITLENDDPIVLSQGDNVEFMKTDNMRMYFEVGDNNTLRYTPVLEYTNNESSL